MERREARLRREYLYRKSIERSEKDKYIKKQALKDAMEKGIPLTREQRLESERLAKELAFDPNLAKPHSHVDDEYANATLQDPRVVITTSRAPSSRLQVFARELKLMIPNSQRINRGSTVMESLVNACKQHDISDLIILHENRGNPTGMFISHLPYGPTAYFSLYNVKLRKDMDHVANNKMPQVYPHLIFNGFQSPLGKRTVDILKHLFPVPKIDTKRIATFSCEDDFISFRQHTQSKNENGKYQIQELGPRFEMKLYRIMLGTIEMKNVEDEWSLRTFTNTGHKKLYM